MKPARFGYPLRPIETLFAIAIALALGGTVVTSVTGCDPNAGSTLLTPTGGEEPVGPGTPCTSQFSTIQMVGDFTTPPFNIPISPQLVEDPLGCIWRATVRLNAGPVLFKFVTDGAFDTPPDYGGSETITLNVPGGPHETSLVSGTGTAIKIEVAATGDYTFTLNERTLRWTAEAGAAPPTGGISGTVDFVNLTSAPFPTAQVEVYHDAVLVAGTTTDPTTRAFEVDGLAAGSYRVVVMASCFSQVVRDPVLVAGGTVDLGALPLTEGASAFTTIDVVGGFNLFSPGVDPMVQSPPCVWTRTRALNSGVFFMKFLTDGSYETPPDYDAPRDTVIAIPGGGPVEPSSTAAARMQVEIATPGTYRITLDERLQRWDAVLVTPAPARMEER